MPARRVAEPYPINRKGRTHYVVRHRFIGGKHVGQHRAETRSRLFVAHRRQRSQPALLVLVGLAALPLVVVMTLPSRLLPAPFPVPDRVPGFSNQDNRTTVPNQVPARPPTQTTVPSPRPTPTPKPTRSPPRKAPTPTPSPAKPSLPLPSLPLPSDPTNGLVPELPLDTPAVGQPVKEDP